MYKTIYEIKSNILRNLNKKEIYDTILTDEFLKNNADFSPNQILYLQTAFNTLQVAFKDKFGMLFEIYDISIKIDDYLYEDNDTKIYEEDLPNIVFKIKSFNFAWFDENTHITNSKHFYHNIKNLYKVITLKKDTSINSLDLSVKLARDKFSYIERKHGYSHSHTSNSPLDADNLLEMPFSALNYICKGINTDLTISMNILYSFMFRQSSNNGNNLEEFSLLLLKAAYSLDTFVKWESLEGEPYRYIRTFYNPEIDISDSIESQHQYIYENLNEILSYCYFKLKNTEVEIDFIESSLFDLIYKNNEHFFDKIKFTKEGLKIKNKTLYKLSSCDKFEFTEYIKSDSILFYFKGEEKHLIVTEHTSIENAITDSIVEETIEYKEELLIKLKEIINYESNKKLRLHFDN